MKKYKYLKTTLIWNEITKSFIQIKKIIKSSKTDEKQHYLSLTPIPDADKDNAYSNMLKFALSQDKIKNIAITGPYGSGKSSVLLTFREQNLQWNYLNISLATFKTPLEGDNVENQKKEVEALEKSILQQLFYSVKQKDIPKSRLKRITSTNKINIFVLATFLFILALSFISIFFPDITILKPYPHIKNKITEYKHIVILLFAVLSFVSLYLLVKYFEIIQELKFKFQDTEITLNNKSNESMLNTYLDEVLYFFERSKVNIVIFEDLDRFNNTEIFIKLRELNELINNSKQINKNIIFIYAIKDDMFLDKDRSKFFDFIIPIIPVINPTNAYYLIKKSYINKFIDKELNDKIEDKFLHQVSLFFDDLRLVTNIFNEFNLYNIKINSSNLNSNKLLALIIYKNYYPKDFSDLHSNTGEIYNLFNIVKSKIIPYICKDIETEIKTIELEISKSDKENIASIQELRKIYIHEIQKKFPIISSITSSRYNFNELSYLIVLKADSQEIDYLDLESDENFKILKDSNSIEWAVIDTSNLSYLKYEIKNKDDIKFSFKEIEKSIDTNQSYEFREKNIKNKYFSKRENTLKKIKELKIKNNNIKQYSLKEILEENQNKIIFDEEKHPPLLQFFIREGYIDEHYPDYISYFIDSVISIKERDYALNVLGSNNSDFELKLNNIDKIISRYFNPRHFNNTSILNYDLLDFIIKNKNNYLEHYSNLLNLLANNDERSKDFIISYINRGKNLTDFINSLCVVWDDLFNYISTLIDSEDQIENLLTIILKKTEHNNINKLNKNNLPTEYISKKSNFIYFIKNVYAENSEKIINFISIIKPSFSYLECEISDKSLFNEICRNEYFEFNEKMILQIIRVNNEDKKIDEIQNIFSSKPYGTLQYFAPDYLKFQVDQSIDHFFEEVYIPSSENLNESSNYFIKLINNEDLKNSHKEWLIENNEVQIDFISYIREAQFWKPILAKNKVKPSWDSLISYYQYNDCILDEVIFNYINENNVLLKEQEISASESKINIPDITEQFEVGLLESDSLSETAYKAVISSRMFNHDSLNLLDLSKLKISLLINEKVLSLTSENVENLRKISTDYVKDIFVQNLSTDCAELNDEILLEKPEYELLLQSPELTAAQKLIIVEKLGINFYQESNVQHIINQIFKNNGKYIPMEHINSFFAKTLSTQTRIKLLIPEISNLDHSNISTLLNMLDEPYSSIPNLGNHSLNYSDENENLINALKQIGYVNRVIIYEKKSILGIKSKSKINFTTKS
ncbi:YobI family P-loop NTPase [Acinetobacter bereziniae]|uniref:YobI-like P-loop NTPase domain-containing protein n=2 Tax=Acinetobacter bereziniae TaxID=106648 RepID=N8YWT6_ACIBZ|nr:hypothetical protein [Acinetobacter bereziniae]ENV23700.1 hypothetical protein F963_00427 [Acinetobacter bereziniae NIPH 3]